MQPEVKEARDRATSNALFNQNKMKLGIFGANCDSGCAMTTVPERHRLTWELTKAVAQSADRAGFEVMVPVARWMGLGGETDFNGRNFETYTWAAALAEATENITLTVTSLVQTINPIIAAKQVAVLDHISGGRACLNMVCGWFQPEFDMFGAPFMEHDARYDYAAEWFDVVESLWTEHEPFQYRGKYFQIDGGYAYPKPIQEPRPAIINAGGSAKGRVFIAERCDVGYIVLTDHNDLEITRTSIAEQREMAAKQDREIQIWTHAYVVQRDTQKEAEDYLQHFAVDNRNVEAVDNAAHFLGVSSEIMSEEAWNDFKLHLAAGYGGYGLVGTAEQIAEKIAALSEIGIDGVAVHWVDYLDGLERFSADVLPRLENAGLRDPFVPPTIV